MMSQSIGMGLPSRVDGRITGCRMADTGGMAHRSAIHSSYAALLVIMRGCFREVKDSLVNRLVNEISIIVRPLEK